MRNSVAWNEQRGLIIACVALVVKQQAGTKLTIGIKAAEAGQRPEGAKKPASS